jgi:hypothetical protein
MTNTEPDDDPFSDWTMLMHKPVYSSDGSKVGFLRGVIADYMVVKKGLIEINKYFIPQSFAESIDRKGRIRLKINSLEVNSKYSYRKMKNTLIAIEGISHGNVNHRPLLDRLQNMRYGTTRNRIAAGVAFVAALLFLASGYRANTAIYNLAAQQLSIHTPREFWSLAIIPIGFLAILSQLGGFTVLTGAGLFAAERVNLGKFLVMIGTGQGLLTIALRLLAELLNGRLATLDNNYVLWLTSSAVGLGILFSLLAQAISKGKNPSLASRALRFLMRQQRRT